MGNGRDQSSFRDPSGFIFYRDGQLLRQVNRPYEEHFRLLKSSGLEQVLFDAGWLVKTTEIPVPDGVEAIAWLSPERIPFISYPYEWSFSQLKDAALLTLDIHQKSLEHGMVLKDASSYNVQFMEGKPIFIDSLSFETYREGAGWIAYRQFCRHFLAPLALMSYVDVRLSGLLAQHIDGIPLDLASKLLPGISKFKPGLMLHLHAHAKSETQSAGPAKKIATISKTAMLALVDSLKGTISSLTWTPTGTEWGDYYSDTNYSEQGMSGKKGLVDKAIALVPDAKTCWDLGANTGEFSRIAAARGLNVISWDIDPAAVEKNYLQVKKAGEKRVLPLLQDLTNPSADIGWNSNERDGLFKRGPADVVLALALIHHLAIGNNVPLPKVAEMFAQLGRTVVVEFVPKEDSQVKRLLANREDIFTHYDLESWKRAVEPSFEILAEWAVPDTVRTLFVLRNRG